MVSCRLSLRPLLAAWVVVCGALVPLGTSGPRPSVAASAGGRASDASPTPEPTTIPTAAAPLIPFQRPSALARRGLQVQTAGTGTANSIIDVVGTAPGFGPGTGGTSGFPGDGGPATSATLNRPADVAVDRLGGIFVLDAGNNAVRKVSGSPAVISTVAGLVPGATVCPAATDSVGDGCPGTRALLSVAYGDGGAIATDTAGNVFIADTQHNRVREVSASTGIITTVAGTGAPGYNGDNISALAAQLYHPWGLAFDHAGNLYIDDLDNNLIREVHASPGGGFGLASTIVTVAGSQPSQRGAYAGDGGPATQARLNQPRGIALDGNGNLYIADQVNNRIRKVTASGGIIATVAGSGVLGFGGDGGPATSAQINIRFGGSLGVDADGNILFADTGNGRVREIVAASGLIVTVAGGGLPCPGATDALGDGCPATQAVLNSPVAARVDPSGHIYILDAGDNLVREIVGNPLAGLPAAELLGGSNGRSPYNGSCNGSNIGSPVNCATGNFWHTFADMTIPGRGLPLAFTHTYNASASAQDGPLGFGWTHSYNMSATTDATTGAVSVAQENGSVIVFTPSAGGYQAPSHDIATLIHNGNGTFTFQDARQATFLFTTPTATLPGQLTREIDRNGYATTLGYAGAQLTTITDPAGRALTFQYNAGGRIGALTDPLGRTEAFTYDQSGNLTDVRDVAGGHTRFTYVPGTHLVQTMTDPNGGVVANVYDGQNRVTSQTDAVGRTTTWSYVAGAAGTQTTTITDPRGNIEVQQYQNNLLLSLTKGYGTAQQATWTYTYDPATLGTASVTDPNGNTSTNTWDASGNLLSHTDALNRTTTLTYDALNDLTSITDPTGVATRMAYDATGNLLSIARPLAQTGQTSQETLGYDPAQPGDVTSVTDPNGHAALYAYDASGDVTATTDPLGHATMLTYDAIGRLTAVVKPNGAMAGADPTKYTTHISYDAFGDPVSTAAPLGQTTALAYDADRNVTGATDANGHITGYAYDLANQLITITRPDGGSDSLSYGGTGKVAAHTDPLGHATTYQYDALDRLIAVTDPLNRTTRSTYDPAGNRVGMVDPLGRATAFSYDTANERTGAQRADGSTVAARYDADGRITASVDGRGNATTLAYDSLNRLIARTDPLGRAMGFGYDLAGNRTSVTDPRGFATAYGYDAANERTSVTRPDGGVAHTAYDADGNVVGHTTARTNATTYAYDALDRVIRAADPLGKAILYSYDNVGNLASATDANGHVTTNTYDPMNRALATTDALGHSTTDAYDLAGRLTGTTDPLTRTTGYSYDAANERTGVRQPDGSALSTGYDAGGQVSATTDGLGHTTRYAYDGLGRRTTVADPTGATTVSTYDPAGNLASRVDALGHATTYTYDIANQRTGVQQADGSTLATAYDPSGNVASATDALGHAISYSYDGLSRLLAQVDPLGRKTAYAYDLDGNRTSLTDPMGRTTSTSYDSLDRTASLAYSDGKTPPVAYTYTPTGQRATMTDGTGTSAYSYDAVDRLIATTNGAGRTVAEAYDAAGNVTGLTYPDGSKVARAYDPLDRMTGVTDWAGHTTSFAYDAAGNMTTQTYPTGNTATFGYDAANRTASIVDSAPGGGVARSFTYTRNVLGQITGSTDSADGLAHAYAYSPLNQLTGDAVAGGPSTTWTLDPANDVTKIVSASAGAATTRTLAYDAAHQLTRLASSTTGGPRPVGYSLAYSYNQAGDRTGQTNLSGVVAPGAKSASLSYDQAHNLVGYAAGAARTGYQYNGDGLRQSKTAGGAASAQTWDAARGLPLAIQDGSTRYVTGPDGLPVEQVGNDGTPQYYVQDQLGSTRGLLDGSGKAVASYSYDAYGTQTASTTTGATTPFGFAGQYTDAESGTQYLRARQYDPATGQFISIDPLLRQTGQAYAYVGNDPLNGLDPTGLCANGGGFCPWEAVGQVKDAGKQFIGSVVGGAAGVVGSAVVGTWDTGVEIVRILPPTGVIVDGGIHKYEIYVLTDLQAAAYSAQHIDVAGQIIVKSVTLPFKVAILCPSPTTVGNAVGYTLGQVLVIFGPAKAAGLIGDVPDIAGSTSGLDHGALSPDAPTLPKGADPAPDPAGKPSPCSCFPGETGVATPHGLVAIDTLRVGDQVLAEDPSTRKVEPENVQAVIDDGVKPLMQVGMSDSSSLRVTTNHPFYVDSGPGIDAPQWVQAGDLRIGDQLRTEYGRDVTIAILRHNVGYAHVYTLTVAHDHTFFVGTTGIPVLVHNCDVFTNQLPSQLPQELAQAAELGVKPLQIGTLDFDAAINEGTVKWIVNEQGQILIIPKFVNGQEISHAVISGGQPVRAAGEADIVGSNGHYILLDINNHSGHFQPSAPSLNIGIQAFNNAGVH